MILGDLSTWATLVTAMASLVPVIAAGVTLIIREIRAVHRTTQQVVDEIKLPSDGTTLGAATEGIAQVQHMGLALQNPLSDIPSAIKLAREIAPNQAPARRSDDPQPPQEKPSA